MAKSSENGFHFPKIEKGGTNLLGGAVEGFDALFFSEALARGALENVLWIVRSNLRRDFLMRAVKFFSPSLNVVEIPAWDCLPYDRLSPDSQTAASTASALAKLSGRTPSLIILPVQMALRKVPAPSVMRDAQLLLRKGQEIRIETIRDFLERWGYRRADVVSLPGDYALRGGLLDVYPPRGNALRLDMFGETLEKIAPFDTESQIREKGGEREEALLLPASEIGVWKDTAQSFRTRWKAHFGRAAASDPLYTAMGECVRLSGLEHYLPLFHEKLERVFSYMPKDAPIVLDWGLEEALDTHLSLVKACHEERLESLRQASDDIPWRVLKPDALWLSEKDWEESLSSRTILKLNPFISQDSHDLGARQGRRFSSASLHKRNLEKEFEALRQDVQDHKTRLCFLSPNEVEGKSLEKMLQNYKITPLKRIKNWEEFKNLEPASYAQALLPLERGFRAQGLFVITEGDILGVKTRRHLRRKTDSKEILRRFHSLSKGDLVVHLDHGVGRFLGLKRIEAAGEEHECFEILYQGEDRLFLPVENAELLSRYGGDPGEAALDHLGASAWQERRARVRKRIQLLAKELIHLAAKRESTQARKILPQTDLYDEFCARFPFETTEDQEEAGRQILKDLASGKPMDRLICGDVGFGKTEVALRAAFLTVMSGHQAAVITPTTLLCRQHVESFRTRFEGLPVKIGHISRLIDAKTIKKTREEMEEGALDIVIGTHALLSDKTQFQDLALLVVDEEQHFGVAHKERLKSMKDNVHLLTLTATPIPRTLQFALSGARDISLIATPPSNRMNVRSFIGPFDAMSARRALLKEKERGGQSFLVAPRVKDLARMEDFLATNLPELSFRTLHGQMKPSQIEEGIAAFYDGSVDVLLSTNIVESGLDIPAANTIIIYRSHMFGLAQLHQLRGRVGRSDRQAYSYFTIPNGSLPGNAQKRLAALQSVDSLGGGFNLAAQDLDMRGAGNLLGSEQSGHIAEVGYELYQKMLQDAVQNLQSESPNKAQEKESFSPTIEVGVTALLPESYIADLSLRLRLYRRLAEMEAMEAIHSFKEELQDRFGDCPEETQTLLKVAALKILCRRAGIAFLRAGKGGCSLRFHQNRFANPQGLISLLHEEEGMRLKSDHTLLLKKAWRQKERIPQLMKFLAHLADIAENTPEA